MDGVRTPACDYTLRDCSPTHTPTTDRRSPARALELAIPCVLTRPPRDSRPIARALGSRARVTARPSPDVRPHVLHVRHQVRRRDGDEELPGATRRARRHEQLERAEAGACDREGWATGIVDRGTTIAARRAGDDGRGRMTAGNVGWNFYRSNASDAAAIGRTRGGVDANDRARRGGRVSGARGAYPTRRLTSVAPARDRSQGTKAAPAQRSVGYKGSTDAGSAPKTYVRERRVAND